MSPARQQGNGAVERVSEKDSKGGGRRARLGQGRSSRPPGVPGTGGVVHERARRRRARLINTTPSRSNDRPEPGADTLAGADGVRVDVAVPSGGVVSVG